jgi:hypothetical protein
MAFMITRIDTGDYDAWKRRFDQDVPRARESALGYRVYRGVENPAEVFVQVEFASVDEARIARDRLLASGVLDRFADKTEPRVVEVADRFARA